jgi:hypothetical protein
MDEPSKI